MRAAGIISHSVESSRMTPRCDGKRWRQAERSFSATSDEMTKALREDGINVAIGEVLGLTSDQARRLDRAHAEVGTCETARTRAFVQPVGARASPGDIGPQASRVARFSRVTCPSFSIALARRASRSIGAAPRLGRMWMMRGRSTCAVGPLRSARFPTVEVESLDGEVFQPPRGELA